MLVSGRFWFITPKSGGVFFGMNLFDLSILVSTGWREIPREIPSLGEPNKPSSGFTLVWNRVKKAWELYKGKTLLGQMVYNCSILFSLNHFGTWALRKGKNTFHVFGFSGLLREVMGNWIMFVNFSVTHLGLWHRFPEKMTCP